MNKLYDAVVKTGEYQINGEVKSRYENAGSVMQGENGMFLLLKRTFNPAGVANPDCKDSVLVSFFEPKSNQQQGNNQGVNQQSKGFNNQQNQGFNHQQNQGFGHQQSQAGNQNNGFAPQQGNGGNQF